MNHKSKTYERETKVVGVVVVVGGRKRKHDE